MEIYPARHGFAVPDNRPTSADAEARHWAALRELCQARLRDADRARSGRAALFGGRRCYSRPRTHAEPWARYLLKPSDHGSYPNKIIDSSRISNIRSIYKQIPNAQPIAAPTSGQERQEVPGDDDVETTRRAFAATPAPVLREVAGSGMMRGISAPQECQNPPLGEAERDPSPYEACQELFSRYPLALRVSGQDSSVRSMVLMLADGGEPTFFVLSHDCDDDWCGYSIGPWPTGDFTDIEPGGDAHVPGAVTTALNSGSTPAAWIHVWLDTPSTPSPR